MATSPEQLWTPQEKRYLLAEIIKALQIPPSTLLSFIRRQGVQYQQIPLEDIPLPPGRSLNSCRIAFYDLWSSTQTSYGQQNIQQQPPTPSGAQNAFKRPHEAAQAGQYTMTSTGRPIQPKPSASGVAFASQASSSEPPAKKKRGRPTKIEADRKKQEKADAAAAGAGRPSPSMIAPQSTTAPQSMTTPQVMIGLRPHPPASATMPLAAEANPSSNSLSSTTRMPIAAMLTPVVARTPTKHDSPPSHSSSSSGKRRRARMRPTAETEEEEDRAPATDSPSTRPTYSSPYTTRLPTTTEETPARAAVLRHYSNRDDANTTRSRFYSDERFEPHPPPDPRQS